MTLSSTGDSELSQFDKKHKEKDDIETTFSFYRFIGSFKDLTHICNQGESTKNYNAPLTSS